jgi:sugar lactone lactonase YvrE
MWHDARKSFFWVDIEQKKFYECRWADKQLTTYQLKYRVSLILETLKPEVIVLAVQGGLMTYNLDTHQRRWITEIEKDVPGNRTNDGACDVTGRIWVGTMNEDCFEGKGALYKFECDSKPVRIIERMTVPNGVAWSGDDKTMYHVDSNDGVVRAYNFDAALGNILFSHVAIQVPPDLGSPDGMCMDEEGMLWIAHWNGYGVYRWNPLTGKIISTIEVDAPQVSCCAFGGEDMRSLLITTARQGMADEQLQKYPSSGDVFIISPGYKGVHRYKTNF